MFDKQYVFRGTHEKKVRELIAPLDDKKTQIFESAYRVYMLAPIVGYLLNTQGVRDNTGQGFNIFPEQIFNVRDDLLFTYRLIMLLDKKYEPDFEKRVNKAFRDYGSDKATADMEHFDSYVLGGVDKLHEKIMADAQKPEDYLRNFYNFMEEIDMLYIREISTEDIKDLCRLAKV